MISPTKEKPVPGPANWEQAIQHYKHNLVNIKDDSHSVCMSNNKIKKLSLAYYLYFEIAKKLILVFLVMQMISLPYLISNANGNGLFFFKNLS